MGACHKISFDPEMNLKHLNSCFTQKIKRISLSSRLGFIIKLITFFKLPIDYIFKSDHFLPEIDESVKFTITLFNNTQFILYL